MRMLLLSLLLATSMSNADVVALVKAGLSAETIELKIASSPTAFDTSTEALVALAKDGVPDRVIQKMIASRPAAPVVAAMPAAARRVATRRYDVTLLAENGGKCEAELRVDGKGVRASRCRKLDFDLKWSEVRSVCHEYGFRGRVVVNGHEIALTTPAEAKRLAEHLEANGAVTATRCP